KRLLNHQDLDYIASVLEARPTLYLDEIQDKLFNSRGVHVSLASILQALSRIALTRKKVSTEALKQNELLCATWQADIGQYFDYQFVFIDESA
ncbi:hypothetical protein BD410DRAFT_687713, partial [Rickenella mellea]